ncbi:MAG: hypothetical protein NZ583_03970 [Desulfobacterota bacterium]|nr:hypothetical protein [Thermodesulfobacteriota bacterium]MDW8001575.1 hypothetical protein [Deltaproteobacteria bacterium]
MKSSTGLTLIELVITALLLSILSIFFFGFLYFQSKTYATLGSARELHEEATYALERITRELRDAKVDITLLEPNFLPNPNVLESQALVFELAHPTPEDPLLPGQTKKYVIFYFRGNRLMRASMADTFPRPPYPEGKVLVSNVSDFRVRYKGGGTNQDPYFEITIRLQKEDLSLSVASTVCPKNVKNARYFRGRSFHGGYEDVIR